MEWVTKLSEAKDKNGETYMWGFIKIGMFNVKAMLFKSKKEDGKWNLNFQQAENREEDKGNYKPRSENPGNDIPF